MPSNKPGSRIIKAAGAVAWRPGPGGEPEILLVHRKKYDDWSLPKGKIERDELLPVTAVREVLEEGGAQLALGRRLASVRYGVGGRPKRVHYWAARVESLDDRAVPNAEVDEVAWVTVAEAPDRLTYQHDHGVLADFAARPVATVPLILLRHAKAEPKDGWPHADADRPLDDSGRAEAKALADLLSCFGSRPQLISSPAVRCTDTLRPLAERTGAEVCEVPSLFIHHSGTDAADSCRELVSLIRTAIASGEPAIICAHRENIPFLRQAALSALAGYSPTGLLPPDAIDLPRDWDESLTTSGSWVLNVMPLPAPPKPPEPAYPEPPPRRWWQRLAGPAPAETAPAAPPKPETHLGLLVSADRYDLTET